MLDFNATTDDAIVVPAGRDDRDERARVMLLALGDNMIDAPAASRWGAGRGARLRAAGFVLPGQVSPVHWPVDEAVEILSRDPLECRTAAVLDAMLRLRAVVGTP